MKADMVLTDPPYGINIVNVDRIGGGDNKIHFGKIGSSKIAKTTPYRPVANDDSTDTAKEAFELMREFSKNQIIFGGNYFADFLPSKPCWCVWDKQNDGNNFADVELAWTSFDKAARIFRWKWNGMVRQGSHEIEGAKRVHPTQKPVGLFGNILSDFTKEGDIVLDLFGGSGTTLIACEQLGRKCRMMELDPHYCQVIIERWEALTGEKAEKIA